jgi:hypothetical protein
MPNDVSYFKVPGDSATYSFNDADAESRIGALESTVNEQAGDIADNEAAINANASAIGTLSNLTTSAKSNLVAAVNEVDAHADANAANIATNTSGITALNRRFSYVSGVSTHTLTASGLYYCASDCTGLPFSGTWALTVIANPAGTSVKQIARSLSAEGAEFEQHLVGGAWSGWVDVGRMKPFSGSLTTTQYFRKAGNANYGSFLIMGTFGGIGGVIIGCTVSNGSIGSVINLLTGAAWSNTNLTITYTVTDGIGYVGLKTASSANSSGVIIGG